MDSRRPLLIPNEGDEPPPQPPEPPLAGVSDFRGRPVYRATSGGWRSALFVAVLEMGCSFSYYGVSANLISYLTGPMGQSNASAAAAANAWSGTARMLPLLGAVLADSFLGRYPSILLACTLYVMGLGMLTVASSLPACAATAAAAAACCPSMAQVIFVYVSLYLVAFAQGFDKPCGLALGAEQFDPGHPRESAARSSLFNWWFFSMAVAVAVAIAAVSYVQENVGWGVGFGVPFAVVSCASAVFLLGTPTYRLYAPPRPDTAMDGKRSSSEEEDARGALRRLLPIWAACVAYGVADAQIMTLFNKQGRMLDRRIGGVELPPAALQTIGPATIVLFVPIYDRAVVPALRRATGNPSGLTTLQRTGAGLATSLAAVATAAAVEGRRLGAARAGRRPAMSWAWLVPQYASMGVADVLAAVGMQEFFHGEMPEGRRSVGLALYCGAVGIGGFVSAALIAALDGVTRRDGGEGWFADDLDRGHLDYFYWLLAGVSAVALAMFLCFARSYAYRNKTLLVPSNTSNATQDDRPDQCTTVQTAMYSEKKKARARDGDGDRDAAERRRKGKAPCLEPPPTPPRAMAAAAAAAAEAGPSRGGCVPSRNPLKDPGDCEAVAIRDTDGEDCGHFSCDMDEIADIEMGMAARGDPMCEHETCLATGSNLMMVCPECGWCFCVGGLAHRAKPLGHIREHAYRRAHWVALRCEDPYEGYCFECEDSLAIESQMVADDGAGGGEEGYGCVVTGMPNLGNTCYLNALLQCLLVLGKLRARILGLGAPSGVLGDLLHDLFVDTNGPSYAQRLLDPAMLLRCVRFHYPQFRGIAMQDCHELLCCLRDGLDEDERKWRAGKMQQGAPSAVAPTVIDSIFAGQLSVTLSCKCCSFKSDSEEVFHDLSMPLPPKGTPARSVASPPRNGRCISQQKTRMELFPAINKTNTEKIHAISEGGDAQVPASESEHMVMVKTSEPLEVDSNHLEQISQSKGDVHGPLQAPTREENTLIASGHGVERTVSAVLDSIKPEDSIEAKMDTLSAEVATEDKGKDRNRDAVYDKADDINSLASIEEILELHLKAEMIEKRCENCSNADQKASPISGKHGEQPVACTNVNGTVDGDQDEQDQGRGKQVNMGHSAHQVEENQYDRPDRNKGAIKTCLFSKLPPVLALHLKRNLWPLKLKVSGHVSFKETLDVKLFMHPSSEDKDNSSYRLVGVVEHLGLCMDAGHFVAYVRPSCPQQTNGSSLWFCASDADIREVSLEEVLKCEAYLLFYERIEG
uniref:Ubiquitinyl hydrolase 1 n=1 Tax=Oryza glumipatula TaxID=40148 RepID=A0A0E0AXY3_9ORYZ